MASNRAWLLDNADAPIRYNLARKTEDAGRLLTNGEVTAWLSRLAGRAQADEIGDIHGSHDYRMENILGKCWILGLDRDVPSFAENMEFILRYLNRHIQTAPPAELSFGKLYHFRDCEKVLACFLPFLGFHADPAVLHVARKRIDVLFGFTKQKRYDIYIDGSKLKGVKREWQPFIINPDLYADGNIALPDIHDLIMFAGLYRFLSAADRHKSETIASWLFGGAYGDIVSRYGYFYAPGGPYNAKAIIFKPRLFDFKDTRVDTGDLVSLLFNVFALSHFKSAIESEWFSMALAWLNLYGNDTGRYSFPPRMITEKPDGYVIFGGHMNIGENKKSKLYNEIISTYWMERIHKNINNREKPV